LHHLNVRKPVSIAFAVLIAAALSMAAGTAFAASRAASVEIVTNPDGDSTTPGLFVPGELYIKKKTTVTWTNNDFLPHTVTEGSEEQTDAGHVPLFDSGRISPSGTYSYTFNKNGEYDYYCKLHPFVTGQVIVGKSGDTRDRWQSAIAELYQIISKGL
jgi:plastocyanin